MMVRLLKSSRSSGLVVNEALREAGGERCVWCDAFLAAFSIFSFSSLLFRRFSPFDSDPPTTQSLFPGQKRAPRSRAVWNRKKERQTQGMRERERERKGEKGAARACPKAAISFFHRQRFLEQAASRWTPPGFGNVSIRDSTGRWTESGGR